MPGAFVIHSGCPPVFGGFKDRALTNLTGIKLGGAQWPGGRESGRGGQGGRGAAVRDRPEQVLTRSPLPRWRPGRQGQSAQVFE